ncbi:hypothetical protein SAMN04489868_1292 [Pisciglobus halotolerans]|uniref:Uncharacterized protein n=1 Tax=Pisciglobus halotolerans TaxID=745365 RepID=A0A1I3D580_9LACT|nr:hypothetical protein SAMN04489868_1292 [Pisciglobus halotolerans]
MRQKLSNKMKRNWENRKWYLIGALSAGILSLLFGS